MKNIILRVGYGRYLKIILSLEEALRKLILERDISDVCVVIDGHASDLEGETRAVFMLDGYYPEYQDVPNQVFAEHSNYGKASILRHFPINEWDYVVADSEFIMNEYKLKPKKGFWLVGNPWSDTAFQLRNIHYLMFLI